jgi:hypothetical protein
MLIVKATYQETSMATYRGLFNVSPTEHGVNMRTSIQALSFRATAFSISAGDALCRAIKRSLEPSRLRSISYARRSLSEENGVELLDLHCCCC